MSNFVLIGYYCIYYLSNNTHDLCIVWKYKILNIKIYIDEIVIYFYHFEILQT